MADPGRVRAPAGPSLPDARAADSVMRAVDFVEGRMGERIGVEDMAEAACYSQFYFSRLFARATGHAPYDYLMRRRVAASAGEVVGGSRSLTDIALDYGFEVPDSFARAFRRCFGDSPSELRRSGSYPRAIERSKVERDYVEAMLLYGPPVPAPLESEGAIMVGSWSAGPAEARAALERAAAGESPSTIVFERGTDLRPVRAFAGSPAAAPEAPRYPLSATSLPGGEGARFEVPGGSESLSFIVEFAYRAWIPSAGRSSAPAYDLVEADAGGSLSLVLPLG